MFCHKCGQTLEDGTAFCNHCGASQSAAAAAEQPSSQPVVVNVVNTNTNTNNNGSDNYPYKSRWTAFFLCLFLGFLGIHRFYVGKNGSGILYLFTVGLLGIGVLIDCIIILCGGFRDKAGHVLR